MTESALQQRSRAIRNSVRRIMRDAQTDVTPTAAREYAEIDLLLAELWAERKIDQYTKLAKVRFDMAVRMRLLPPLYRPSTSVAETDDPYVREHLEKLRDAGEDV